jgi:plastocyanin
MAPDTMTVVIEDFAFSPETVEVDAGATIEWSNRDGEPHSVRAEDGSITSTLIVGGSPFEWVAEGASGATIAYFCGVHPGMKGTVEIR